MGKKDKDGKKRKSGKKKIRDDAAAAGVAAAIVQAARSMRTVLSRNLLETGLYAGQDGVILALAENGGMTAGGLAAKLGVKAPTMTRTIGRLEAQGFVERRTDNGDGRLTVVHLTEAGQGSLQLIEEAGRISENAALDGFSDKEVRTLVKLLRAIDDNLHRSMPDKRQKLEKTVDEEV
ncbi:MAG: MarR family transcriptional regulator [Shinella sp.]|nr:MarR family transcriptional regulator [Shinella sp.]